jgi:hypothetical protein
MSPPPQQPAPEANTVQQTTPVAEPVMPPPAEIDKPEAPVATMPPEPKPKPAGSLARHQKKRVAPVVKQERSEEIERLRTQAFSETRKDRLERINGAKGAAKLPISSRAAQSVANTRRAFAECDRSPNILRREQCRWRVCGGRWGRHGCPSYEDKQLSLN